MKTETAGLNKASTAAGFVFESVFGQNLALSNFKVALQESRLLVMRYAFFLYLRSDFKYQIQIILTNG